MRVLLVEDEPHLGSAVQEHVRAAGHAVDWFERLEPAEHAVRTVSYDALLLDLHLPDGRAWISCANFAAAAMRCRSLSSPRATWSVTGSRG